MSPWGKLYLETVEYNPLWWEPFGSWRMWYHGLLDHMIKTYRGNHWRVVSRHLDALEKELRNPCWNKRCE